MRILSRAWVVAVLALFVATPASAANVYNLVWDGTLGNDFNPGEAGEDDYSSQQFLFSSGSGGMPWPALSADFDADKSFQIVLSGAAGQAIQVTPPSPPGTFSPTHELLISLSSFTTQNGEFIDGTFDGFSFTGLQGASPALGFSQFQYASGSFIGGTNRQFSLFVIFDVPGTFSFTSLTLGFTAPASMDLVLDEISPIGDVSARSFATYEGATPDDPTPWVSLVPEPSTWLLAICGGLGGFAMLARRRR
jgi:hypothetical protein